MRKLILLCMVFVFTSTVFAQTTAEKKAKAKTEAKVKQTKKKTIKTEKKVKETKTTKLKKDGTVDKRYKADTKVRLKKDGTPDKRYVKENNASSTGRAKSAEGKAKAATNKAEARIKKTPKEEKEDMRETTVSKSAERKVKDKVSGSYKLKKVFTGPRGGRYYINKNGNKTYISDDK